MMSDSQKICVLCGLSCAGQPRIKNAKGHYAHKVCVEANQRAEAEPVLVPSNDDLVGDMGGLLSVLAAEEAKADASVSGCPGCGIRMEHGALVCMHCGFNTQTGKSLRTRKAEAKPSKAKVERDSKIAELGEGILGLGMKPILPLIGAAVGGAIGAAIWAAIAYSTGLEVGFVAILVGSLCGLGARIGGDAETTGGGLIAGIMAACMAILAIGSGKYVALSLIFEREYGGNPFTVQTMNIYDIDEEGVRAHMAFELCRQRIDAGEEIGWDNLLLPVQIAQWPDDYPLDFQDEVYAYWDTMSDRDQLRFRRDIANENGLSSYRDVEIEWALQELADEMAYSKVDVGESIDWPDPQLYNRAAMWPEDYPEVIQDQVQAQWASLGQEEQNTWRQHAIDAHNESAVALNSMASGFTYALVIESFKRPVQLLFVAFAIWWAYRVGNSDD